MPTYCYESAKGHVIEEIHPWGQAPRAFTRCGVKYRRSYQAESVGVPPTKGWPMECVASGVNSEQAGQLTKHLADAGVPTQVTPDGNPVYKSASHRRRALKARGIVDRSSYV